MKFKPFYGWYIVLACMVNFFAEVEHTTAGKIRMVNSPVKFCQNPSSIRTTVPEVGQHTEELLLEAGYT